MRDLYFDERCADAAVRFFERLLYHVEGEWAGRPFTLLDWQREQIVRPLFGWRRADGSRRYRKAYVEIPRKNGKSTLSAGIALYLLFADDEPGAQVFSAAADREQAGIVFNMAKAMVEQSPQLLKRCEVFKREIYVPRTRGRYRVLSADAFTKHGLNAHGVIFDELHAQPNRDLWDVLNTSTGARRQPLFFQITTAGYDQASICWEQHEYGRQVLDGTIDDPSFFAYIAAAGAGDDYREPATWYQANPSLGQTVKLEYLQEEARRAQLTPSYENTFRRLHLNQWTQQETRWIPVERWDEGLAVVDPDALRGRECYGGLDLSATTDLSAFALVFPATDGSYQVLVWLWMPAERLREAERKSGKPYAAWAQAGWITATEGNVIDYDYILETVVGLSETFGVQEIGYDPWNATQLVLKLQERLGENVMVPVRQGFASLSAPSKEFERLVTAGALKHGPNPVLRWMIDCTATAQDPADNIKPVKPDRGKSTKRIDGIVATIIALDRAMRGGGGGSSYDDGPLFAQRRQA